MDPRLWRRQISVCASWGQFVWRQTSR